MIFRILNALLLFGSAAVWLITAFAVDFDLSMLLDCTTLIGGAAISAHALLSWSAARMSTKPMLGAAVTGVLLAFLGVLGLQQQSTAVRVAQTISAILLLIAILWWRRTMNSWRLQYGSRYRQ